MQILIATQARSWSWSRRGLRRRGRVAGRTSDRRDRAADERGMHHSGDGGVSWMRAASYPTAPQHQRGRALVR